MKPSRSEPRSTTCRLKRLLHVGGEIGAEQLRRGEPQQRENRRVDFERALPGGQFARGGLHGEGADLADQAGALGGGAEIVEPEQAEPGMAPHQHGFQPGDRAVVEPGDRLKLQFQLAAFERAAKLFFERADIIALHAHEARE